MQWFSFSFEFCISFFRSFVRSLVRWFVYYLHAIFLCRGAYMRQLVCLFSIISRLCTYYLFLSFFFLFFLLKQRGTRFTWINWVSGYLLRCYFCFPRETQAHPFFFLILPLANYDMWGTCIFFFYIFSLSFRDCRRQKKNSVEIADRNYWSKEKSEMIWLRNMCTSWYSTYAIAVKMVYVCHMRCDSDDFLLFSSLSNARRSWVRFHSTRPRAIGIYNIRMTYLTPTSELCKIRETNTRRRMKCNRGIHFLVKWITTVVA